jgi:hypothetical protein
VLFTSLNTAIGKANSVSASHEKSTVLKEAKKVEHSGLLEYYTVSTGKQLPTFRRHYDPSKRRQLLDVGY